MFRSLGLRGLKDLGFRSSGLRGLEDLVFRF